MVPIPTDWAGLLLMGFGCLFLLMAAKSFFDWINQVRKGEPFERWDALTEEFIKVRPTSELKFPLSSYS